MQPSRERTSRCGEGRRMSRRVCFSTPSNFLGRTPSNRCAEAHPTNLLADRGNRWYVFAMPDYRRLYVPGGTYFFTVVTQGRAPILTTDIARPMLRDAILRCRESRPFDPLGWVLL